MSAGHLLTWMSARGSGSWPQFRTAVNQLVVPPVVGADDDETDDSDRSTLSIYQQLRLNFERLGFAEFFGAAGDEEWRVAPPVLVIGPSDAGQTGFVTGARSDSLMRRVETAFAPRVVRIEQQENCPNSVFLDADDRLELGRLALSVGLIPQHQAPMAILAAVDELNSRSLGAAVDPPLGKEWTFERFHERTLRWESTRRGEFERTAFGLYRLRFRYRTEVLMRWSDTTHRSNLPEGKYLALKRVRKQVLSYHENIATLSLPAICRPPILIDRALTLCSGKLPTVEMRGGHAFLHYNHVSPAIAASAASLLRQRLL